VLKASVRWSLAMSTFEAGDPATSGLLHVDIGKAARTAEPALRAGPWTDALREFVRNIGVLLLLMLGVWLLLASLVLLL
jgi:hypothetical protein